MALHKAAVCVFHFRNNRSTMNHTELQSTAAEPRKNSPFLLLLFLALVIRGGVLFVSLSSFDADPDDYARLADNWTAYGIFGTGMQATAFRPPLYPWTLKELSRIQTSPNRRADETPKTFLSNLALSRNASIALWHWTLGLFTVLIVYGLALLANLSPRNAAIVGLLVAIDPILLQQSRLIMTETLAALFSALMLLSVVICIKKRYSKLSFVLYLCLGFLFGLSTLCRPAFYAFIGLVFLAFIAVEISSHFFSKDHEGISRFPRPIQSVLNLALFLVGIAVITAPWLLRNLHEFQRPILTTTHSGYTLYLANNPEIYRHYETTPAWTFWNPEKFHAKRALNYQKALEAEQIKDNTKEAELFQDYWTREEAKKTITASPRTFLYSCFIRVGELWRIFPNDVERLQGAPRFKGVTVKTYVRYAIGAFYGLELFFALVGLIGLIGICIRRKKNALSKKSKTFIETPFLWGVLLILSVQIPHLVYWTNMRMRAPLEVFIPLLTVTGIEVTRRFFSALLKKFAQSTQSPHIDNNQE